MRVSLSLTVLLLVTAPTGLLAASNIRRDAACDVRELRFFNGFRLSLPRGVCVIRESGPDYWIYQFTSDEDGAPFLRAYVGNAANVPYFAPPDGVQITESVTGEKLVCGALLIRETPHGDVTQVGGSVTLNGKACGEVLVRATSIDGTVSSRAIHFWYSGISKEQEQVVQEIIGSVQRSEQLPDDPPLKSGGGA